MQLTPVHSSMLKGIGYDPGTRQLTVQFHKGSSYEYKDVPPQVFSELLGAESPGGYFLNHVKGAFEPTKIALPEQDEAA